MQALGIGQPTTLKELLSIQGISTFLWLLNPNSLIIKKSFYCTKGLSKHANAQRHVFHQSIENRRLDQIQVIESMFVLHLNHGNFTYYKMLIVLRRPRATLALLFIAILNMDVYSITNCLKPPSFLGYKIKISQHLNGCWMIHHNRQAINNENTQ
jgi:hypothetical protein